MTKTTLFEGSMNKLSSSAAAVLLAVGVLGSSQALAAVPTTGITVTKHNLGSTGNLSGQNKTNTTGEICVFCHTPHGADTTASVPLWNRTLGTPADYTTYNSLGTSSLDGATAPVGSVSLACLSCHDGTQAMNTMMNAPGSGNTQLATTWQGNTVGAGTGLLSSTAITNIGQDLQNDHPIGIQYAGGMTTTSGSLAYTKGDIASTAFKDQDFNPLKYANLNGQPVWWVETSGSSNGRQKTDMMLYTRDGADSVDKDGNLSSGALTGEQAFVECASCHDPHTQNTTFLRISNTGSAVCLACHIK